MDSLKFQAGDKTPVLEGIATLQRFVHKTNRWRLKLDASGEVVHYEERQLVFFASCEEPVVFSPRSIVSSPPLVGGAAAVTFATSPVISLISPRPRTRSGPSPPAGVPQTYTSSNCKANAKEESLLPKEHNSMMTTTSILMLAALLALVIFLALGFAKVLQWKTIATICLCLVYFPNRFIFQTKPLFFSRPASFSN